MILIFACYDHDLLLFYYINTLIFFLILALNLLRCFAGIKHFIFYHFIALVKSINI